MPVPKRKLSRARRDSRAACKFIRPKAFTHCTNCKETIATHVACLSCGFYKGIKVLATKNERSVKRLELRQKRDARKPEAAAE
jgi:large subunit ribosomal protein L32